MAVFTPEKREEVCRDWSLIRWDAGSFLTSHEGYPSKLFHHRVHPGILADLARAARYFASGTICFAREYCASLSHAAATPALPAGPFALLITVGGPKYAHEEQALREACAKQGLGLCVVHGMVRPEARGSASIFDVAFSLRATDHASAFARWLREILRGLHWFFARNVRCRQLFVAALPMMRDHHLYRALARRLLAQRGAPCFALSLVPSLGASVTLVEAFRERQVPTGALRSQLTGREIEHVIINTDVLFGKCRYEADFYRDIFGDGPPRVREGCVLSLPGKGPRPPLAMPAKYALVLGTAPFRDQAAYDYDRFVDKCFAIGRAAALPVVYKTHGLARKYDDAWFARHPDAVRDCLRVDDARRNRELIEGAAIVITAPSTLVYFAIQCARPVVLVDFEGVPTAISEFVDAPTLCIPADQPAPSRLDWAELRRRTEQTTVWFESSYYLDRGAESIVACLLDQPESERQALARGVGTAREEQRG